MSRPEPGYVVRRVTDWKREKIHPEMWKPNTEGLHRRFQLPEDQQQRLLETLVVVREPMLAILLSVSLMDELIRITYAE
jgi:hypothetical protein